MKVQLNHEYQIRQIKTHFYEITNHNLSYFILGVLHEHMTLIWCLSPLIGFFLTPIMGSLSDRCKSNLGRRRPFIILLSIGVIFGKYSLSLSFDMKCCQQNNIQISNRRSKHLKLTRSIECEPQCYVVLSIIQYPTRQIIHSIMSMFCACVTVINSISRFLLENVKRK